MTRVRRPALSWALSALPLALVSGLHAQSTWDQYAPGQLFRIAVREREAAIADPIVAKSIAIISVDRIGLRARLVYLGQSRPVSITHRAIFRQWRQVMRLPASLDSLFTVECLFGEDTFHVWVPIQEPLRHSLLSELRPGDSVTVLVSYIGAQRADSVLDWLFTVNEWDADGPDK